MLGRRKGECENEFGASRSQARVKPGRRNISAVTDQVERVGEIRAHKAAGLRAEQQHCTGGRSGRGCVSVWVRGARGLSE